MAADRHHDDRGITKLGQGEYLVRARGLDPRTGREVSKQRKVKAKSAKQARAERDRLAEEIATGPERHADRVRLGAFASSWLERRAVMLRASTADRYGQALAHVEADLGQLYLDAVLPADVERWQARALRDGYSPATANGWLRVLRQVAEAAERDLGCGDFTKGVKALREPRTSGRRGTALDRDQFRTFLQTTEDLGLLGARRGGIAQDIARMLVVLAWTGLRRGELLALRCSDVVGDELRIERSVWRHTETSTKTDDPRRVALVEPATKALAAQRRWLLEAQHPGLASGLLFPAHRGYAEVGARARCAEVDWYRTGSCLDRPLSRVVEGAGLPGISLHSLRRTWENLTRRAGVADLVRRAQAGWRTDRAQAIYATVDAEERAAGGKIFVGYILDSSGDPAATGSKT